MIFALELVRCDNSRSGKVVCWLLAIEPMKFGKERFFGVSASSDLAPDRRFAPRFPVQFKSKLSG